MIYKHIVFDVDGTLLNTEYSVLHSLQATLLDTFNMSVPIEKLTFALGITGEDALKELNIKDIPHALKIWTEKICDYSSSNTLYDGIYQILKTLNEKNYTLGIVTSRTRLEFEADVVPFNITSFFDTVICADDTVKHKPFADPLLKYMELSGANENEVLYIGDSKYDKICAENARVDFALAKWGAQAGLSADCCLEKPCNILDVLSDNIKLCEPWLSWAMEIQSIAQCGLTYAKDRYDIERYERLRDLSAEMVSLKTDISKNKVKDLFCSEAGYQTLKIDTRAAVFKDNKILLVQENDGKWSLPGGWADVFETVKSNTEKEVREEAGLDVSAKRIIAIHDWKKRNKPIVGYGICKIFVLCELIGGEFKANIETVNSGYFSYDNLPNLSEDKNTKEQIKMCFEANLNINFPVEFD